MHVVEVVTKSGRVVLVGPFRDKELAEAWMRHPQLNEFQPTSIGARTLTNPDQMDWS